MRASANTPVSRLGARVAHFPRRARLPHITGRSTLTSPVSGIAVGTRVSPGPPHRSNEKIGRYFASCTHSLDLVRMYNTLYLGLDAHTRNCVLATMNSPGRVVSTREFSTSETALIRYVTELPARSKHLMLEGIFVGRLGCLGTASVCNPVDRS